MTPELMEEVLSAMQASPDATDQQVAWWVAEPGRCTGINKQRKREGATGDDLRCKLSAVSGGWGCSRYHAGSKAALVKAEKRVDIAAAKAEAAELVLTLGPVDDVSSDAAIKEIVGRRTRAARFFAKRVERLGDEYTQEEKGPGGARKTVPHIDVQLSRQADMDALQAAGLSERLGVDKGHLQLAQDQKNLAIAEVLPRLEGVLVDLGHKLDDEDLIRVMGKWFGSE